MSLPNPKYACMICSLKICTHHHHASIRILLLRVVFNHLAMNFHLLIFKYQKSAAVAVIRSVHVLSEIRRSLVNN